MIKALNLRRQSESNSINQQEFSSPRGKGWRRRILLGVGCALLFTIGGGLTYAWFFIQRQLAPLVEKELAQYLNRPVNIGQVERFSLGGVRFGSSEIPATSTDPDRVWVRQVEVTFNPLKLLTGNRLQLNVTLVRPDFYIEQDENGSWISTELASSEEEQGITIDLQGIGLRNAEVVLVARSEAGNLKTPVKALVSRGKGRLSEELMEFELAGKLVNGGNFQVDGVMHLATEAMNLVVMGNNIEAADIGNLIGLPLNLQAGKVGGNLEVKLRKGQLPALRGIASLQQVTARIPQLPQSFSQTNGQLRFKGSRYELENVTGLFGSIPGVANGIVDMSGDCELEAQTEPIKVRQVREALKLSELPVPISGEIEAAIRVTGPLDTPKLSLEVVNTKPSRIDKVDFLAISASLELIDSTLFVKEFQAVPAVGGRLRGKGQIKLPGKYEVSGSKSETDLRVGTKNQEVSLHTDNPTSDIRVQNSEFVFDLQAYNIPGNAIARIYDTNLPVAISSVSGQARLFGEAGNLKNLRATGSAIFQLGGGTVRASNIQYWGGRWQGNVRASGVQLSSLPLGTAGESLPSEFLQGRLNGAFNLSGSLEEEEPDGIRATGSANLSVAGGTIKADKLQLAHGLWAANLQVRGIQLGRLFPEVPSGLGGLVSGTFNLAGSLDSSLEGIRGSGEGRWAVAGGIVRATNVQLAEGKFEAVVAPGDVELSHFSTELRGRLGGRLNVAFFLKNVRPTDIQVDGELIFSEGISLIDEPLTAAIRWNGQRLEIQRATASGFNARGFVDVNLAFPDSREGALAGIEHLELDVEARGIDLQSIPIPLPKTVANLTYSGRVDFEGAIAGTPTAPKIEGGLTLRDFAFPTLAFDPVLAGTIRVIPGEQVNLQLGGGFQAEPGKGDRIGLALDSNYQPVSFFVQLGEIVARGHREEELLQVDVENFPIGLVKDFARLNNVPVPEAVITQPLSGELSGNFALNLENFQVYGNNVAIANPVFGSLKGDRFTGNFQYADGDFALALGQFQINNSEYLLDGSLIQTKDGPQFQAQVQVARGQIQDILVSLQIFEFSDFGRGFRAPTYGSAADLYQNQWENKQPKTDKEQSLFSVGLPEASVLNQLRRISEVEALLRNLRKQRVIASPLPELSALGGTFDGTVVVSGSLASGVKAQFDFQGKEWQWGSYKANQLSAKGYFQDGVLTLEPISIQSKDSLVAFSGSFGSQTQSGKLQLVNVPIDLIQDFVELPPAISFGGMLNGTVTIAGSRENPQARGELAVLDATINQTSIQSTQGNFSYNNARLNFFASSVLADDAQPLTIAGSFPYKLPFASVKSDSDKLSLTLNVKDEGLALLNILTRGEVAWVDGNGEIKLDISGSFDEEKGGLGKLRAQGIAKIENATIAVQVLPEAPLSEVSGKILFNFDRIRVESLRGNFSGGEVRVAGTLPLSQATPQDNPLTVTLGDLAFNFKGLYQGGVRGEVRIAGSALEPDISGEVDLFDGKVLLGDAAGVSGEFVSGDRSRTAAEFDGLKLKLADNIQITRPPILNFVATGSLTLNGTLYNPRPEGTIRLQSGEVNLFTTQLRLAGGDENTARFVPNRGLDPYLDVRLAGGATETTRNRMPADPLSAEVSDLPASGVGGLQTVRIQAKVKGLASQLANSIELTSIPPRSQTEIIALLGGGFVNTLGRGGTTLGLANLAGKAFFGSFQGEIGKAFGLSEFRIFPTPIIDDEERTSNLGLGAEASVDLNNQFSFSVLKILTTDQSPQFGIRYRLNDNTILRGSTDFSQESRGVIEYEQRF
ncbi:MAG: translocation/assembly module TamB domain-containing protein [Xenococcaceae cyanobacterium]